MRHPIPSARRLALAATVLLGLSACDGGGEGPVPLPEESLTLQVVSRDPQPGVAGGWLPERVRLRVVDESGRGVAGRSVSFAVASGGGTLQSSGESTDADGYVEVAWFLGTSGEQRVSASVAGGPTVQARARLVEVAPAAAPMMGQLMDVLPWTVDRLSETLALNPDVAEFIQPKIDLLRTPGLGPDIVDGRRYVTGTVTSRSGATVPVTAAFPAEAMRAEAGVTVDMARAALPVLEAFTGQAYPATHVRIWYGFGVGASGGAGNLHLEDRTNYLARTQGRLMPHDAITVHEVSHGFMRHEGLNQFLELYAYNVTLTGSRDPRQWTHTRGWVPDRAGNADVHALLDVYDLLGPDAMATAYRAVLPLNPPYGQPLAQAAKDAFVAAVPQALQAQVAAKLERVDY